MRRRRQCTLSQLLTVLLIGATVACCIACGPKYTDDPGLAQADLGIGISLGMPAESVSSGAAEVWVLTREELNTRSPYGDRPPSKDLVVALYYSFTPAGSKVSGALAANMVNELRCYLADPADSKLKLLGETAATLSADDVVRLCGEPLEKTLDVDGATHLRFIFKPLEKVQAKQYNLELVTSHKQAGSCFAFSIAIKPKR